MIKTITTHSELQLLKLMRLKLRGCVVSFIRFSSAVPPSLTPELALSKQRCFCSKINARHQLQTQSDTASFDFLVYLLVSKYDINRNQSAITPIKFNFWFSERISKLFRTKTRFHFLSYLSGEIDWCKYFVIPKQTFWN